jgi:hypothetical protein
VPGSISSDSSAVILKNGKDKEGMLKVSGGLVEEARRVLFSVCAVVRCVIMPKWNATYELVCEAADLNQLFRLKKWNKKG